ncbi:hypothetical protein CI238_13564 [Colletotrichum incanum]|uniref:Uncharacterized protein n=1 Tax=Colletotrichum incanum TaxID=1573173 RepID=A0A162N8B7_COLIC|nr:hypothetical protein CI238_13564 [Colletotrichum incanum]
MSSSDSDTSITSTVRPSAVTQQQSGPTNLRLPSMDLRAPSSPLTCQPGPKRYGSCQQARLNYSSNSFRRALLSSGPSGQIQHR